MTLWKLAALCNICCKSYDSIRKKYPNPGKLGRDVCVYTTYIIKKLNVTLFY